MTGWEGWVISISVGLVAIALIVLIIFLILLLQSVRRTLRKTDRLLHEASDLVEDVEEKLHSFDSYFRVLSGLGGTVEKYTSSNSDRVERRTSTAMEIAEWGLVGLSLFENIRQRWR